MLENSWLKEHQQKLMLNSTFKTGYKKILLFFHNQASVVEKVESAPAIHLIKSLYNIHVYHNWFAKYSCRAWFDVGKRYPAFE